MSKKAFEAIAAGLKDAIALGKGAKARGRAHKVRMRDVKVADTRGKLGLSQEEFAAAFGCHGGSTRAHLDGGDRDGSARVAGKGGARTPGPAPWV